MKTRIFQTLRHPLSLLLIFYLLYAGLFIWKGSYEVDGKRYFLLFDDAMISMRYAKNLVEGHGLVWNPGGERVEGFTNPLWTFLMAGVHLLPFPASLISLPILLLAVLLLTLNIIVVYRITLILSGNSLAAGMIAAIFTAFYFPLNHWGYLGMEVSLLTLLVSTSVLLAIRGIGGRTSPWLYFLLGLGTLVRMDAVVPAAVILGFLFATDPRNRTRHLLVGALCVITPLFFQTIVRLWYYGDVLPNTYYLKMTGYPAGERILHGLRIAFWHLQRLNPLVLLLISAFLFIRRERILFLPAAVVLGQLAYSTYVGGDAWEWWGESNRYVTVAAPMVFVLFAMSATTFADLIQRKLQLSPLQQKRFLLPVWGIALVALFLIVNKRDDWDLIREVFLLKGPVHMFEHRQSLEAAALLDTILTKEGTVAVVWAGVVPYFLERNAIDILGKNDKYVARLPAVRTNPPPLLESFYPGHMKYDYGYSVGTLKPDVILRLWMVQNDPPPSVKEMYWRVELGDVRFFARKNSENIRWEGIRCSVCKLDPRSHGDCLEGNIM